MASYDNLTTEQPWSFRAAFSDLFTKETEMPTQSLESSFSTAFSYSDDFSAGILESLFPTPVQTPTVSSLTENEALVSNRRSRVPPSGRVAKRKSRASRRTTTTFIFADSENFSHMVQQVTGFESSNEQLQIASVLRPNPYTTVNSGSGLPILDSSALSFNGSVYSVVAQPSIVVDDGGADASEHYLDSFCSFPTLESWKAT